MIKTKRLKIYAASYNGSIKLVTIILCLAISLSMAGCDKTELNIGNDSSIIVRDSYDVSMEIVDGTLTSTKATVLITNNTDMAILSGNKYDFSIEILQDDKWKTIDSGERSITAEAIVFMGESELEIDWTNIYGELPRGKYRIVKNFISQTQTENGTSYVSDRFYLAAEFILK